MSELRSTPTPRHEESFLEWCERYPIESSYRFAVASSLRALHRKRPWWRRLLERLRILKPRVRILNP